MNHGRPIALGAPATGQTWSPGRLRGQSVPTRATSSCQGPVAARGLQVDAGKQLPRSADFSEGEKHGTVGGGAEIHVNVGFRV